MEKIIHFTIPEKPSESHLEVINLARAKHPSWEIKIWQDPISSEGFPLAEYYDRTRSGAQLADLIRLDVVYLFGGIYMDSDFDFTHSLDLLSDFDHFFCSEDGFHITNAAFGAAQGHPTIKHLIDTLLLSEPDWTRRPNETTGPSLFTKALHWWPELRVLPRDTFYPYNWNEEERPPLNTTLAIHRWEGSWMDKTPSDPDAVAHSPGIKSRVKSNARKLNQRFAAAVGSEIKLTEQPSSNFYSYGTDIISITTRGIYMSLSGEDISITPSIALTGTYEERELQFLEKVLGGGDFFIDVGCNVGVFSLLAARCVGPFGRVHAFDANKDVLNHLKRALVMNWWHDRVVLHANAVGAHTGVVQLSIADALLGGSNLGGDDKPLFARTAESLGEVREVTVPMVRLDDAFTAGLEIKLLKIDVEGAEAGVVQGAMGLFESRSIAYVLMEMVEELSVSDYQRSVESIRAVQACGYLLHGLNRHGDVYPAASISEALRGSRNVVLVRPVSV